MLQHPQADCRDDSPIYDDGNLRIEHDNYYVCCRGQRVLLSRKEFLIVSRLARNSGRIASYETIWLHAWGADVPFNGGTLRVHVNT